MREFVIEVLKEGQKLTIGSKMIELKPTKLFLMPSATHEESMGLAFILSTNQEPVVVTQISLKMLTDAMPDSLLKAFTDSLMTAYAIRKAASTNPDNWVYNYD